MAAKFPAGSRHFISEWAVTFIFLLFGTTSLLQAFVVPTESMDDTLKIGDHLLVDKLAYAPGGAESSLLPYAPVKRGDVIVFRYPIDLKETYVKRVIGVPGDRVRLENKQVFVNGRRLSEPYVHHIDPGISAYRDDFPPPPGTTLFPTQRAYEMIRDHARGGEMVVPPGQYFAMGDNRDNSSDSRFWGFVPRENIIGKPLLIYWSYDAPTEQLLQPTPSVEHVVDVALHFFTKTRWERFLRPVRGVAIE